MYQKRQDEVKECGKLVPLREGTLIFDEVKVPYNEIVVTTHWSVMPRHKMLSTLTYSCNIMDAVRKFHAYGFKVCTNVISVAHVFLICRSMLLFVMVRPPTCPC